MNIFAKLDKAYQSAEAAITAASRAANGLAKLKKRLDIVEEHLKALEDAVNDEESQKLRAEKDYIDGMYNMLNYNIDTARKAKGREAE